MMRPRYPGGLLRCLSMACFICTPAVAAPGANGAVEAARAALATGDAALALAWLTESGSVDGSEALSLAVAGHAGAPAGCEAAWAAVERCRAHRCGAETRHIEAIERRCLVERPLVVGPFTVEFDGPPAAGRVVAGRRRATLTAVDGTRRTRALCLAPGEVPRLDATADDARLVPVAGARGARAKAHHLAAVAHERDGRACEAAMEFEAARALVPGPATHFNAATAHERAGSPCDETLAAFAALMADPAQPLAVRAASAHSAARARCTATLVVESATPGAEVTVDGAAPPVDGVVPVGARRVEAWAPGHEPAMTWVSLAAGEMRTVRLEPRERDLIGMAPPLLEPAAPDDGLGWLWAPIAVTAAGLAVGGTFTALAAGDRDDFDRVLRDAAGDQTRSYRGEAQAALDEFDRDRALAVAGFGLAAAGAVTFGIGWLLDGPPAVVPAATPVGPGIGGRF